jgi:hypothetical protein
MNWMRWARVCVVISACFIFGGAVWGQTTGDLRGEVKDITGAVVPGATVTSTLIGTSATRMVTTGQDGEFDIPELPVGTYIITTEAAGFKKAVAKDVVISIGHVAVVNVTLQVGGKTDTVTIEANAVQVETTSTQLGGVMTDKSISALPLSTRNAYQLLQLQPGVQSQLGSDLFTGSDNPGVVSVNGGRGRSNNYMVNGGDGNDLFVNAPAIQPSPDAIEEFRVLTNTFDAEYGRNSGSVVNVVTKSGTNDIHGDFYEFLRNNVLNTANYISQEVPDYKQNQFGATLGGPIRKDRTFIFGSYEGNRLIEGVSAGTVDVPTPVEAANGDFSLDVPTSSTGSSSSQPAPAGFGGMVQDQNWATILANRQTGGSETCAAAVSQVSGAAPIAVGNTYAQIFPGGIIPTACFDPTALALFQQYVSPYSNAGGSTVVDQNEREHSDQFTVRFDHKINSAQQFSVYYYYQNSNQTDPYSTFQEAGATLPGFGDIFATRVQQWNISHTWTIGSTAVNEFRFNFFREGEGDQDHPVSILPGANGVHSSCGTYVAAAECFQDTGNLMTPNSTGLGITTQLAGREGVPYITTSGFSIGNNEEGELPQAGNTFQISDNFTKTFSKHTIKFGVDARRDQFNQFLYYDIDGAFNFTASPVSDQIGANDSFPAFFLGTPNVYSQGAAQGENDRNTAFYLFAQDSFKLKPNVTVNYGLRWELNTPFYDNGNRLQTFRPGQATTQYPCWLSTANAANLGLNDGDCGQNSGTNNAIFPLGLVFPGDKGVPKGLTSTYYKAFAPRIGIAYSPDFTEGWLAKLFGGPGNSSIRAGYGIFYNPIEQLVLEQFSAEPPFGGSSFLSSPLFNLPYLSQSGTVSPNPFGGVINQTPQTPCGVSASTPGPNGCVDWSTFRPLLLFGEFQPHLKSQYADQYNLTVERQLSKAMLLRVSYVGTQAHHLLASHDLNTGNIQTCLAIMEIATENPNNVLTGPGGTSTTCGPFGADSEYYIAPGTTIPSISQPTQPFPVAAGGCVGLPLPYNAGTGSNCLQAGSVVPGGSSGSAGGITLVGTRPYSSPNCQPYTGIGCPADGVPVFSNIFAEDTIANSNYNALQVSVERSSSHGLLFQASYTYSKAIDQGASFENELNSLNYNATRGDSLLDAKHRFVFSPVWDIPIPKYDGFKGKVLDGWGASAIITYQSGFPIRVYDPDDPELQSSTFFEAANTPTATAPVQFENPKTNGGFWFNPNNFTDATVTGANYGVFGNAPHALCCGPAISNTDLVISKKTRINERWDTEFRSEFYNAWNHTQFANPDGDFADSTFGQIQKTREDSRVMQFGLKFLF